MAKQKKAGKTKERSTKKNKEKTQLNWILGVMVGIIVLLIIVLATRYGAKDFNYKGIQFEKVRYGEILLYRAAVPIYDIYGNLGEELKIDFRKDPRKLEHVPININETNPLEINTKSTIYIGVDPEIEKCEDYGLAVINFGGLFFNKASWVSKVGSTNRTRAEEEAVDYVSCGKHPINTNILFVPSNKTEIVKISNTCYEFRINNCEALEVAEKFEIEILKKYMDKLDK